MDNLAIKIVKQYILEHREESEVEVNPLILWMSQVSDFYKYLVTENSQPDNYYELTYSKEEKIWTLNVYDKSDTKEIPMSEVEDEV